MYIHSFTLIPQDIQRLQSLCGYNSEYINLLESLLDIEIAGLNFDIKIKADTEKYARYCEQVIRELYDLTLKGNKIYELELKDIYGTVHTVRDRERQAQLQQAHAATTSMNSIPEASTTNATSNNPAKSQATSSETTAVIANDEFETLLALEQLATELEADMTLASDEEATGMLDEEIDLTQDEIQGMMDYLDEHPEAEFDDYIAFIKQQRQSQADQTSTDPNFAQRDNLAEQASTGANNNYDTNIETYPVAKRKLPTDYDLDEVVDLDPTTQQNLFANFEELFEPDPSKFFKQNPNSYDDLSLFTEQELGHMTEEQQAAKEALQQLGSQHTASNTTPSKNYANADEELIAKIEAEMNQLLAQQQTTQATSSSNSQSISTNQSTSTTINTAKTAPTPNLGKLIAQKVKQQVSKEQRHTNLSTDKVDLAQLEAEAQAKAQAEATALAHAQELAQQAGISNLMTPVSVSYEHSCGCGSEGGCDGLHDHDAGFSLNSASALHSNNPHVKPKHQARSVTPSEDELQDIELDIPLDMDLDPDLRARLEALLNHVFIEELTQGASIEQASAETKRYAALAQEKLATELLDAELREAPNSIYKLLTEMVPTDIDNIYNDQLSTKETSSTNTSSDKTNHSEQASHDIFGVPSLNHTELDQLTPAEQDLLADQAFNNLVQNREISTEEDLLELIGEMTQAGMLDNALIALAKQADKQAPSTTKDAQNELTTTELTNLSNTIPQVTSQAPNTVHFGTEESDEIDEDLEAVLPKRSRPSSKRNESLSSSKSSRTSTIAGARDNRSEVPASRTSAPQQAPTWQHPRDAAQSLAQAVANNKRAASTTSEINNTITATATTTVTPGSVSLHQVPGAGVQQLEITPDPISPVEPPKAKPLTRAQLEQQQEIIKHDGKFISLVNGTIKARSINQDLYLRHIMDKDITFGIGPAGTGKTYLAVAVAVAVDYLMKNQVKRIVLTRPAVEAGESLGFLPGDLSQKLDPYLKPLFDALQDIIGPVRLTKLMENGIIEIAPLAYMRGRTLSDAFVILDEAQNTTIEQMKMFLTRLGFGSKMVVTGDTSQIDLPVNKKSGLIHAQEVLEGIEGIPDIKIHNFYTNDIVRHPTAALVVGAYEQWEALHPAPAKPKRKLSLQDMLRALQQEENTKE